MAKESNVVNCLELVIVRLQEDMCKWLEGTQHKELEIAQVVDIRLKKWFLLENKTLRNEGDDIEIEILSPLVPLVINYLLRKEPHGSTSFISSTNTKRTIVTCGYYHPEIKKTIQWRTTEKKARGRNKKMVPPSLNVGQGVTLVYKEGQMVVLSHEGEGSKWRKWVLLTPLIHRLQHL